MVQGQGLDVDSFLKKGYWQNTRAKSPDLNVFDPPSPIQYPSHVDPAAPRRLPYNVGRPRRPPPPPSVEDEIESLSKELGSLASTAPDEEPPNRGAVNQCPIMLEVHEHNPERRFVLVANSSDSSDDDSGMEEQLPLRWRRTKSKDPQPEMYEANTGRKYDVQASLDGVSARESSDKKHDVRPAHDRRRSRLDDLPAIVTEPSADPRPSRESRKARSATGLEQTGDDYFSPIEGTRTQPDSLLSPDVIKHSTRGKDRAYWDGGGPGPNFQGRHRPAYSYDQRNTYEPNDGKPKESRHKAAHSASPTFETRQATFDLPTQTRRAPKESYDRARRDTETRPARLDRKDSSRSYGRSEREFISQRPPSYRDQRNSPPYDSSEDDSRRRQRREEDRRRRKSFVRDGRSDYLEASAETRSKSSRRRSQPPSPDPTIRGSQGSLYESSSSNPRSSTFPRESKSSSDEDRQERPLSRASTARSAMSSAAPIVIPAVIAAATSALTDSGTSTNRRKSTLPPLPKGEFRSERSSTSTVSSSASRQNWQQQQQQQQQQGQRYEPTPPPPPPHQTFIYSNSNGNVNGNSNSSSRPLNSSYRTLPEYSPTTPDHNNNTNSSNNNQNKNGNSTRSGAELPDIPHCPRTREEAGHVDWLTFPRCDNFNVCPTCYQGVFARGALGARFAHALVPAPFRPSDRPIACDFGRSPWYQLAWYQTLKYERADLALLHGVRAVLERGPPCAGSHESYRAWYSVRDPASSGAGGGRPVEGFGVCHTCARLVETVLPNLTGVFVPVSPEPSLGVCALRPTAPSGRGRGGRGGGDDEDTRERFMQYLLTFETVSDEALDAQRAPDVQDLAGRIGALAALPECRRDAPVRDGRWFVMRSIPDFTVCEACFHEVVAPKLPTATAGGESGQQQDDRGDGPSVSVAGDFHYRPQHLPLAACQLWSDRMRDVFSRAVRRRDMGYLESKVRERRAREQEYYAKVAALDRQKSYLGPERTAQEAERLLNEWKRWE